LDHRPLGKDGPPASLLGLGCNNFGRRIGFEASRPVVHKALDLGVTLFDTADIYAGANGESEAILGRLLGPRRKDVVIATKFGMSGGASRRHVLASAEASLKRLKTDWIDLYQLHRPDPSTPFEETLAALDTLVKAGKVRQAGCSYLTGAEFERSHQAAAKAGIPPFATCQNEYSLLVRDIEHDLAPALARHGAGFLPYLPLAGGLLTGKYRRDAAMPPGARLTGRAWQASQFLTARNWRIVEALEAFCAARGHSLLDLAMSWLAAQPFVTSIIAGATKAEQVEANLRALAWRLTPEELAEIDRLTLTP
jgi:aryl-alcohol dehydrogenase-like predicted oxidoreductase